MPGCWARANVVVRSSGGSGKGGAHANHAPLVELERGVGDRVPVAQVMVTTTNRAPRREGRGPGTPAPARWWGPGRRSNFVEEEQRRSCGQRGADVRRCPPPTSERVRTPGGPTGSWSSRRSTAPGTGRSDAGAPPLGPTASSSRTLPVRNACPALVAPADAPGEILGPSAVAGRGVRQAAGNERRGGRDRAPTVGATRPGRGRASGAASTCRTRSVRVTASTELAELTQVARHGIDGAARVSVGDRCCEEQRGTRLALPGAPAPRSSSSSTSPWPVHVLLATPGSVARLACRPDHGRRASRVPRRCSPQHRSPTDTRAAPSMP